MYKALTLALIVALAYSQNCGADQFYYNYQCVDNSCIFHDLASLQLVKHRTPELDNVGQFNRGFGFSAEQSTDDQGNWAIKHVVSYQDSQNDPLIKPATCLDATIYQTANDWEINSTRLNTVAGSLKPTWPAQIHESYDTTNGDRIYYFYLELNDLQTRCVICENTPNAIIYQCFFEMAITLASVDQASYFFASFITVSKTLTPNVLNVNWINIIQVDRCLPGTACEVTVNVASELLFCCDIDCTYSQSTQFGLLWINKPFFIEHKITDVAFQSWYINVQKTVFSAAGFKLYLDWININQRPGSTVLEFNTPVAQQGVTIAVTSVLQAPQDFVAETVPAAQS